MIEILLKLNISCKGDISEIWLDSSCRKATHFLELLHPLKVQEGEDALTWKDYKRGNFSVKSYYISLRLENNLVFPGKEI